MLSLEERIAKSTERTERLKLQQREREKREREKQRKADERRKFIIGGIVIKHFPDISQLEPRRTTEENNIEFEPLENFFSVLAADETIMELLKESVAHKITPCDSGK